MAEKQKLTKLEREAKKAADFIQKVMEQLDIAYKSNGIKDADYKEALSKLLALNSDVEEYGELLNELDFQIDYNKELEKEHASQIKELEKSWNEYFKENEKAWEETLDAVKNENEDQIKTIMQEQNKLLNAARAKYDPENLHAQVQSLKDKLAEKDSELAEVRTFAENTGKELNEAQENIARLEEALKEKNDNARKLTNLEDSQGRAQKRIVELKKEVQTLKAEASKVDNDKIKKLEGEIEEKNQEIERYQVEIEKYQSELELVDGQIDNIKRNVIQSYLCKEFGLPENAKAGIERAKALRKAMKKAKHDKSYETKLENVANSLRNDYPHVFGNENAEESTRNSDSLYNANDFADESKKDELYDEVEKTLKSTIYKGSKILKGIAICASALLVAAIFVGGAKMLKDAEAINEKDKNITTVEAERDSANADRDAAQKTANEATTSLKTAEDKIGALEAENEQLKQNQSTQVQEKQDFVLEQVQEKTKNIINDRARGNIQNVAFSYNSATGSAVMVAEVERDGDITLVVGETMTNVGSRFDSESIQKLATSMDFNTYNNKDNETGVYYRIDTVKGSALNTVKVSACQVEYGADGSILDVVYSEKSKSGKEVNQQEVVNVVVNDILSQQTSIENE